MRVGYEIYDVRKRYEMVKVVVRCEGVVWDGLVAYIRKVLLISPSTPMGKKWLVFKRQYIHNWEHFCISPCTGIILFPVRFALHRWAHLNMSAIFGRRGGQYLKFVHYKWLIAHIHTHLHTLTYVPH